MNALPNVNAGRAAGLAAQFPAPAPSTNQPVEWCHLRMWALLLVLIGLFLYIHSL